MMKRNVSFKMLNAAWIIVGLWIGTSITVVVKSFTPHYKYCRESTTTSRRCRYSQITKDATFTAAGGTNMQWKTLQHEPCSYHLHRQPYQEDGEKEPPVAIIPKEHPRRSFLKTANGIVCGLLLTNAPGYAAITDETNNFADNWWDSSSSSTTTSSQTTTTIKEADIPTDEVTIEVSKKDFLAQGGLGIELAEIEFKTNLRIYVKTVRKDSLGSRLGIQKDWIIVSINDQSTERTNVEGVAIMVSRAVKNTTNDDDIIRFRFRDPSVFRQRLTDGPLKQNEKITTQVAPAGDTTQRNSDGSVKSGRVVTSQADQRVVVEQLVAPKMCKRGAEIDDLLEISYIGRVVETGAIFDGSAIKINGEGIPGRGDDVSLFFVLGKQPFGQFPPGWDVGLVGQCIGERRRLTIPPVLAYGSVGMPKRNIPPDATLQYDITLVSINGLSLPQ